MARMHSSRIYVRLGYTTTTGAYQARFLPVKVTQGRTRLDPLKGNVQYKTLRRAAI